MIEVFRKKYDSESIVDLEKDLYDIEDDIIARFDVPKNENGHLDGTIEVIVNVHPKE